LTTALNKNPGTVGRQSKSEVARVRKAKLKEQQLKQTLEKRNNLNNRQKLRPNVWKECPLADRDHLWQQHNQNGITGCGNTNEQ
jgi:hypothetical protein